MKYLKLQFLLLFIIICFSCNSQESTTIKQIDYSASTRGSSIKIIAYPNQIVYNNEILEITPKKWTSLTSLIQEINLDNLKNLKAPSEDRFRDAALAAEIKIITSENIFTSPQFDHGNPPKELKPLLDKLNALLAID